MSAFWRLKQYDAMGQARTRINESDASRQAYIIIRQSPAKTAMFKLFMGLGDEDNRHLLVQPIIDPAG